MILVSLAAGIVVLLAAWAQAERRQEAAVLFAVGLAGPVWFYAVSGWEHAPAIALSTLAFACVLRGSAGWALFLAGLCLGAGATLRTRSCCSRQACCWQDGCGREPSARWG